MNTQTFFKLPKTTKDFIKELELNKIPLSQINVNDFSCNTKPSIYITIPHGIKGGGKFKIISNNYLNARALKYAIKFYYSYVSC